MIAGGLLQDLEDRLRRELAPIEERVRPGEEMRGLAGEGVLAVGDDAGRGAVPGGVRGPGGQGVLASAGDLVIVIPGAEADPDRP